MLLASTTQRLGKLLNILSHTGQSSPNVTGVVCCGRETLNSRNTALTNSARNHVSLPRSRVSITNQVMRWPGTDRHTGNLSPSVMSKSLLISKSIRIDLSRGGESMYGSTLSIQGTIQLPGGKKQHDCTVVLSWLRAALSNAVLDSYFP